MLHQGLALARFGNRHLLDLNLSVLHASSLHHGLLVRVCGDPELQPGGGRAYARAVTTLGFLAR